MATSITLTGTEGAATRLAIALLAASWDGEGDYSGNVIENKNTLAVLLTTSQIGDREKLYDLAELTPAEYTALVNNGRPVAGFIDTWMRKIINRRLRGEVLGFERVRAEAAIAAAAWAMENGV